MRQPEFWSISRVIEVTGLSKTVIYREMRIGRFPSNHPYRNQPRRRFWLSTEVQAWQQSQLQLASVAPVSIGEFDALMLEE